MKTINSYLNFALITFIILSAPLRSQRVQWAHEVVGFSSEFVDDKSSPRWRASQVLGKPSVMPQGGASACAWSPKKENRGKQWIHVRYKEPMQIKQVAVAENSNC